MGKSFGCARKVEVTVEEEFAFKNAIQFTNLFFGRKSPQFKNEAFKGQNYGREQEKKCREDLIKARLAESPYRTKLSK